MQQLIRLIADAKKKPGTTDQHVLNLIREYLQVRILQSVYQSKYGTGLCFIGGTCLRICYDLKRYSEDLDFTLDRPVPNYSFMELNRIIVGFLNANGFEADCSVSEDKVVQKSFIGFSHLLNAFSLSPLKNQRLHIKLEIDTRPTSVGDNDIETFFVTKFDFIFPILKHTEETLFAGKISAALSRTYTKGRDLYDLIWYLNRNTGINFTYLRGTLAGSAHGSNLENAAAVLATLKKRIATVDTAALVRDIGRFIEDPSEELWLKSYPTVFDQAMKRYLHAIS